MGLLSYTAIPLGAILLVLTTVSRCANQPYRQPMGNARIAEMGTCPGRTGHPIATVDRRTLRIRIGMGLDFAAFDGAGRALVAADRIQSSRITIRGMGFSTNRPSPAHQRLNPPSV